VIMMARRKRKLEKKPFNLEKSWGDKKRQVPTRPMGTQVIDNNKSKGRYNRNKAKSDLRKELEE
jgi:hypothetical protein